MSLENQKTPPECTTLGALASSVSKSMRPGRHAFSWLLATLSGCPVTDIFIYRIATPSHRFKSQPLRRLETGELQVQGQPRQLRESVKKSFGCSSVVPGSIPSTTNNHRPKINGDCHAHLGRTLQPSGPQQCLVCSGYMLIPLFRGQE
jgi:hypothetical protein